MNNQTKVESLPEIIWTPGRDIELTSAFAWETVDCKMAAKIPRRP
jgi:hypothetical protein